MIRIKAQGMNNINIRLSNKVFTDIKRFPYGFRKSGDFSISDANILSSYGHILQALEQGQIEPISREEKHFLKMSKGLANPQTAVERAWRKYIQLSCSRKNFFTLNSSSIAPPAANDDSEDYISDDLEIEA